MNHKVVHGAYQLLYGGVMMITSDVIMQLFPEKLDLIHPGVIHGLKEQFEFWVVR